MVNFHIVNLGCKVNRVESDALERFFVSRGLSKSTIENAHIIVVNTCTVTSVADKKTRKAVRGALRNNESACVIVTGCAQVKDPKVFLEMSDRIHTVNKFELEEYIERLLKDARFIVPEKCNINEAVRFEGLRKSENRYRQGIKVQDGCENGCTYRIVWKVRGDLWSLSIDDAIAQARELVDSGVCEIMLTGINLGRYCSDGKNLTDLMRALLAQDLPCRFRLSSIEPQDINDDLIDLIASSEGRICRHLHIPLQSGSTRVLKEMGRDYSSDDIKSLVKQIREKIDSIALTTDVIVGFPGERDCDFEETLSLVCDCAFSKVHVFPYSMREGTLAAQRFDQIASEIKHARARKLRELSLELSKNDLASRIGTHEFVVVNDDGTCMSESYHHLRFPFKEHEGSLVEHEITSDMSEIS